MTYEEQLKHPLWLSKRNRIIERDWGICQKCMSPKNLQVHHIVYVKDRMAWDYADHHLITLCSKCHTEAHDGKEIPVYEEENTMWDAWDRIRRSVYSLIGLAEAEANRKRNG